MRGSFGKLGGNDLKHACHISQNIVIPKPQNPVVVVGEPFVSNLISHTIGVLTAVSFNDKATLTTDEIDRIEP